MIDWWFDIDGKIGRIQMDIGIIGKPEITFLGDVEAEFVETKTYRTGKSYVYETADGHTLNVNEVKFRGERYVSLYIDRRLIKEYNVRAEKYRQIYMRAPELYESRMAFLRFAIPGRLFGSLAVALLLTLVASFSSAFDTLSGVFIFGGAVWLLLTGLSLTSGMLGNAAKKRQMEKYALISSLKKRRKKKYRRHKKTPFIRL